MQIKNDAYKCTKRQEKAFFYGTYVILKFPIFWRLVAHQSTVIMVSATLLKYREFQNPNQKIMTHMGHSDSESLKDLKRNIIFTSPRI